MSFSELTVVLIVAVLVMKPKDILALLKKFKQVKSYLLSAKSDITSYLDDIVDLEKEHDDIIDDREEINLYLQKILALGENYNGNYNSYEVKQAYHRLVRKIVAEKKKKII
ncbi:MAG: hypothetical protein ACRYE9_05120 [Janthinobacterium lividum]